MNVRIELEHLRTNTGGCMFKARAIPVFEIISNPYDLEIRITEQAFIIKRGPEGGSKLIFSEIILPDKNNDPVDQVSNFLRKMIRDIEDEKENDPQLRFFNSSTRNIEDIEMLTYTHVDIIEDGLRMHDGHFITYM